MPQHGSVAAGLRDGGALLMGWKGACFASALLLLGSGVIATSAKAAPVNGSGGEGVAATQEPDGKGKQPATLDMADLERRLAEKGATIGSPLIIRIFKDEAELELWVQTAARFELFAVYPICNWSGTLGPKLTEGDRQSPEGLYSIGPRQLHRTGRWPRSLDIGFPNTFDKAHGRTGSYILLHGGCTSIGCYAMTDRAMEEIFTLSEAALRQGQERIEVHAFPFRMTHKNMAARAGSAWSSFWLGLKEAYDLFERTRLPPQVRVCNDRYAVGDAPAGDGTECIPNVSEVSVASARVRSARRADRARKASRARRARVARRTVQVRQARRGRKARQAQAASRRVRTAANARRHASRAGGPSRR
jgi:murein L,D-transpeptidase YafK